VQRRIEFHIVLRKTVGIILLVGGLYLYAWHLLDHHWTDAHFVIRRDHRLNWGMDYVAGVPDKGTMRSLAVCDYFCSGP